MLRRVLIFVLLFATLPLFALDWIERRRDQYGTDFSYFLYPIVGDIPGLGEAAGAGVSILNITESDVDFTGFKLKGDFDASGYTLLDYYFFNKKLILDVGYYDFNVAPLSYARGIRSNESDYILPKVKGKYGLAQLTYSTRQRQFETYIRVRSGWQQLLNVLDKDGNEFPAIDTQRRNNTEYTLGFTLDNTDDRLDPRSGYRLEMAMEGHRNTDPWQSDYFITDANFTYHYPVRRIDSLVLNLFHSNAHIYNAVKADLQTLREVRGLGCDRFPPGDDRQRCLETEQDFLTQQVEANKYGTASSLGGTQRLRSYSNGRFYAGNALFYGAEYRLNLTEEYTPFNIYIAKGIRTGFQLALFAEQGSVAEHTDDLLKTLKTSAGIGLRIVLAGVIIRADYANGSEGPEFILFINYPWSMFSVDS